VLLSFALIAGFVTTNATAVAPVDFARDVQPLFAEKCVSCHGPNKRKGGLRLDLHASVLAGGATGPAIDTAKDAHSLLVQRVRGEGDEDRMPPEGDPLTEAQILLLQRWINEGAVWADAPTGASHNAASSSEPAHWAYRAPKKPAPAVVKSGSANNVVRNEIDTFVIARLQKEELHLSPSASRETQLRRASFDLIGLPPTLAEVEAFVRDRRPDAWQRQIDRLLASPHFGERWARWWLDQARYADSNGYEKDKARLAWKYRDWVINAFNSNMSFKQFTIEQLAGDMLPNATESQRIATGFHRNTLINQEGGVDPEEAYFETLVDRVGTTASVWLGTTLACSQCHNHKFDPFSQKDFYKFMAFFSNGEKELRGSLFGDLHMGEPMLPLANTEQAAAKARFDAELALMEAEVAAVSPEQKASQQAWEQEQRQVEKQWQPIKVDSAISKGGAKLKVLADGSILAGGKQPPGDEYEIKVRTSLSKITAVRLEVLADKSLPKGGPGRGDDGGFLLTGLQIKPTTENKGESVKPLEFSAAAADEQVSSFGPATLLRDDPEGWAVDVEAPSSSLPRQAIFVLRTPVTSDGDKSFTVSLTHVPRGFRSIGRFRLSASSSAEPLLATQIPRRHRALLLRPIASRTAADLAELDRVHRKNSNHFNKQRARIDAIRKEITALAIPTAMVMQERVGFERPSAFLRIRGAFTSPADRVFADVPKALPPLLADAPANRLGLARWLVDEGNPLTARVTVNRFWEQLFGRGLLETSEDFGTQSPLPSHPELLDWLATEYMRVGWDNKAILRTIMLSATYQQQSLVSPVHNDKDPGNRLFARAPRFRLDAETLRDAAMANAGLLSPKVGGPSVFPWQPAGVWEVPYNESFRWNVSSGQDALRRTLYTFLRRSAPYPFLINFDATSRETCTLRRPRTNTPLQVLNTLNDPVFFKAAQGLAARMQREGGKTPASWIDHGFRLVSSRAPTAAERSELQKLFDSQHQRFANDPKALAEVLTDPTATDVAATEKPIAVSAQEAAKQKAALTLVANVLLNLDEAITKE